MNSLATDIVFAYPLKNIPEPDHRPKDRHIFIHELRGLAGVGGFFSIIHPDGEKACPYDHMTNEEVMESIIFIPLETFAKYMKTVKVKGVWSQDMSVRIDGLPVELWLSHIITHETMHLLLGKMGEHEASRKIDTLSRSYVKERIGHSPYYTLGLRKA